MQIQIYHSISFSKILMNSAVYFVENEISLQKTFQQTATDNLKADEKWAWNGIVCLVTFYIQFIW